jgi:hypothetical protein
MSSWFTKRLASMTPRRLAVSMSGPVIGLTLGGLLAFYSAHTAGERFPWVAWVAGSLIGLGIVTVVLALGMRWARKRS